jgi:hypothetical protein
MLIHCAECHREVATSARHCPHCGSYYFVGGPAGALQYVVAIAAFIFIAIVGISMMRSVSSFPFEERGVRELTAPHFHGR